MALGYDYISIHKQDEPLGALSAQEFIDMVVSACEQFEWDIHFRSEKYLEAWTDNSGYGEQITIEINHDTAHLESKCKNNGDWNLHKSNIKSILLVIEHIKRVKKKKLPQSDTHD